MFNSIFTNGSLTAANVLIVMASAIAMGLLIALYYTKQNRTTRSFAYTLAFLPLITATVIMVVNGNLGAGIAVAGSFSLIRFRSIQGSGQEILAVFLCAATGLCLGAGYAAAAGLLIIVFIVCHLILTTCRFGPSVEKMRELKISVPEALDYEELFDDILGEYFTDYELDFVRTVEMGTAYQLVYHVVPKDNQKGKVILDTIRERNGNLPVSLGRIPDSHNEM
ncbi:MAG: DUF4956 domain-containing protein [Blautia sp.]|nr:DUF4956 domain-containing protein [Blautia sp.]